MNNLKLDLPKPDFPPYRLTVARNARDGFHYDPEVLERAASAPAGIVAAGGRGG